MMTTTNRRLAQTGVCHRFSPRARWAIVILAVFGAAVVPAGLAFAAAAPAYDSFPSPFPGNYNSQGFQANRMSEFGDHVRLQPGTSRELLTVDVGMSSWACETGSRNPNIADCATTPGSFYLHPVTLNIYEVGSAPYFVGPLIVTNTTEFQIPYRPSPDLVNCPATTKWFKDGVCNDGFAFPITFDLSADGIILPDEVIVTVTYNTQNWGYFPLGSTGPYNALNVGAADGGTASVGSIPDTGNVVMYADNLPTGLNTRPPVCGPTPVPYPACDKYKDAGEELVLRRTTGTGWFDYQFVLRVNTLGPRPVTATSVPTIPWWGMIVLPGLLILGVLFRRRQSAF